MATKREKRFEVLWYLDEELNTYETKEFYTRKQAIAYYDNHKNDNGKFGWWVTHRGSDWDVLEDIVY